MSSLLWFSKSTRDPRTESTRDQLDLNIATEIKLQASPARRTPDPVRRKSVSSDSLAGKILDSSLRIPTQPDDQLSTQSPPRLSVLAPQFFTFEMGRGEGTGSVYDPGDAESCHIGMAIGSPTEQQKPMIGSRVALPAPDTYPADPPVPQFVLPPVPVEVKSGLKKSSERNQRSGGQEEPSKGGWKKLFGRSFFGKKSPPKQSQTAGLRPRPYTSAGPAPPPMFTTPPSPAPCLDVDIPGVEMERYSVMFGTLLHPGDRSSLLSRRGSGYFQGLGEQDQREDETPQPYLSRLKRNATTGQVCRSPVSMLGDSSPYFPRSPPCSPGLSRSMTTSGSSSPRAAVFAVNPNDSIRRSCSLSRNPSSRISRISEESSIDTPRESFDDDEWLTRADEAEPQWEMLTQRRRSTNTPMSEEDIEYAAQISIARQISISQRQLLLPIIPKSQRLVSRPPTRKPPPPPIIEIGDSTSTD